MNKNPDFEAAPVRLSSDETRVLFKLHNCHPKPMGPFWSSRDLDTLADLGLAQRVKPQPDRRIDRMIARQWQKIQKAVEKRNRDQISSGLSAISKISGDSAKYKYVLTPRGLDLARGLTVRKASVR